MNNRQQALINAAKSGRISEIYRLISDGADPFYFDKSERMRLIM